jgi:hypothetical protein
MNLYLQIVACGLLCVLLIVAYGTFRCKTTDFVDPLTKSFFKGELSNYLDGWGISHFLFFAFLGYKFNKPKYILFSFVLGVIWEIIEYFSKDKPFYISECKYDMTTDKGQGWWYGRYQDVIMNSLGLYVGYIVSKKI